MPQNNVLPDWRATYPNDAPVQKPPGVTVSTTATAPRVPNKFTYNAGTIQMYDPDLGQMVFKALVERAVEDRLEGAQPKTAVEMHEEHFEEPTDDEPHSKGSSRRRR